jgi:hypothetical protein
MPGGNARRSNLAVEKEILSYFLHNPGAADTLTEIARWRLMQEMVRRSVERTEAALKWLTAEGYISAESHSGTEPIFQLNPARKADAEALVHEEDECA